MRLMQPWPDGGVDMADPTMSEVLAELRALRQEVEELRSRQAEAPGPPPWVAPSREPAVTVPQGAVGRRVALRAGLVAAGATAVALVADATPAAAANGDPIVLGSQGNLSTGATIVSATTPSQTVGFGIWDVGRPGLESGVFPAVSGHSQGSSFNTGVEGINTANGTGVRGQTVGGDGVNGVATGSGRGVLGESEDGTGVVGSSLNGWGLLGQSANGAALVVDGRRSHIQFNNSHFRLAPTLDLNNHGLGEIVGDSSGQLWLCTGGGTPGTWRKLAGPGTAGAFHVLPSPARVYDSRVGTSPSQGPKTKLSGNVARTIDCTVNSSGVPADATAVAFTVLLVNAFNGNGNMTIWANGAARPAANTMVWGTGSGRYTSSTISAAGAGAKVQASASAATDLVLDIVGFYR